MKKGAMEKRFVYDEANHPSSVSDAERTQTSIDEAIKRFPQTKTVEPPEGVSVEDWLVERLLQVGHKNKHSRLTLETQAEQWSANAFPKVQALLRKWPRVYPTQPTVWEKSLFPNNSKPT